MSRYSSFPRFKAALKAPERKSIYLHWHCRDSLGLPRRSQRAEQFRRGTNSLRFAMAGPNDRPKRMVSGYALPPSTAYCPPKLGIHPPLEEVPGQCCREAVSRELSGARGQVSSLLKIETRTLDRRILGIATCVRSLHVHLDIETAITSVRWLYQGGILMRRARFGPPAYRQIEPRRTRRSWPVKTSYIPPL
jgi:hypothetical protein